MFQRIYQKSDVLNNFDVYPIVIPAGKETEIHLRSLGGRVVFQPDTEYQMTVCALDGGDPDDFPASGDFRDLTARTDAEGAFCFPWTFDSEQEYFIRVFDPANRGKMLAQVSVYCVEGELKKRYPFIGDLHMHTTGSDGNQAPAVVCANYRKYGYDFTVISDHRRYYPSLQAIEAYRDVPIELNIVPGEEVHLPRVHGQVNDAHIVNFGGEYSINALVEDVAVRTDGRDLKVRAIRENDVPDIMTIEEFEEKMTALAAEIQVPEKVDALPAAMCKWAFDEIRKAGGLAIFPHPNWRPNVYHVPEVFVDYLMDNRLFDAFEVLGGENYYEHNGFQTARYYDQCAKGNRMPIVGSTDSHSSNLETNRNGYICSTIIFSPENERKALIRSVKDYYSVAVDTISAEFRLVGEMRLVRYACFLLKNYYPLHDELCYEEGRAMKQYVTGAPDEREEAAKTLAAISGRVKRHREKYFAIETES
ncbi:MAG: hypothetical protein IJK02_04875 [Clostridia bacterium]|nr:hypothetical protein [Clostridia bacterium]